MENHIKIAFGSIVIISALFLGGCSGGGGGYSTSYTSYNGYHDPYANWGRRDIRYYDNRRPNHRPNRPNRPNDRPQISHPMAPGGSRPPSMGRPPSRPSKPSRPSRPSRPSGGGGGKGRK